MAEHARRPGLSIWAGLDEFGTAVVSRLDRWQNDTADAPGVLPAVLLPRLNLVTNPQSSQDKLLGAARQLLESGPARQAAMSSNTGLLVVHIWLVADMDASGIPMLTAWLARVLAVFEQQRVTFRIFLLLRHLTWQQGPLQRQVSLLCMRDLIESMFTVDSPGTGRVSLFVVSDRNGLGGTADDETVARAIHRFADLVYLGGIDYDTLGAAFSSVPTQRPWQRQPVFGSLDAQVIRWDDPARKRQARANVRREPLAAVLRYPTAGTFTPVAPEPLLVHLEAQLQWSQLKIPTWSPRFLTPARVQYAESQLRMEHFLAEAKRWRHKMLVTHRDGVQYLRQQAIEVQRDYRSSLDEVSRGLLGDQSVAGFFNPLYRLYDRAQAELDVSKGDAPMPPPSLPDTSEYAVPGPDDQLAGADRRLIAVLERKVNPTLFVATTLIVYALLLSWTIYGAYKSRDWTSFGRLPSAASTLRGWLSRKSFDWIPQIQDFLPSLLWVSIVAAIGYALLLGALAWVVARRQRVALEQAWSAYSNRARQWRTHVETTLKDDLHLRELVTNHDILAALNAELAARRNRLRSLDAFVQHPVPEPSPVDPAIASVYPETVEQPEPMSQQEIERTITAFRRQRLFDPAHDDLPDKVYRMLLETAAEICGDLEPELATAMIADPALKPTVMRSVPTESSVRILPIDTAIGANDGTSRSALAVPSLVHQSFAQAESASLLIRSIPVQDRFYAATLKTGLDALRVFGHEVENVSSYPSLESLVNQIQKEKLALQQRRANTGVVAFDADAELPAAEVEEPEKPDSAAETPVEGVATAATADPVDAAANTSTKPSTAAPPPAPGDSNTNGTVPKDKNDPVAAPTGEEKT